jgi:hypothetical protein
MTIKKGKVNKIIFVSEVLLPLGLDLGVICFILPLVIKQEGVD